MVGARKGRIVAALFVASLTVLSACGGSSESRDRNAMSLIGTSCKKPGSIKTIAGVSYVCGHIKRAKPKEGLYYGVAAIKNWICAKPGATRYQNGIFSVCSGGSKAKSRKWALTVPMPVSVSAIIEKEESSAPGALETIGVPIPDGLVNLPGSVGPMVGASTTTLAPTSGSSSSSLAATTTSTSTVGETTTTGQQETQTTTVQPQGLNTTTAPGESTTVATTGSPSTVPATTTTPTTAAPTTVAATVAPSSTATVVSTTTTTVASTTTAAASMTVAPTSPPTTSEVTTTTAVPAAPKTCAEGGPCVAGDTGPGGGQVFDANFDLGKTPTLVEAAPVTWFVKGTRAQDFVTRLRFGGMVNWRLPTDTELMAMRRDRLQFRCPNSKRCAKGFSNSPYWASGEGGLLTVDFAGPGGPVNAASTESHYLRPVRTIRSAQVQIEIEPS